MQISHALRRTLSVVSIPREVPGTRVNLDTCRILVDGQIRFEYRYVFYVEIF